MRNLIVVGALAAYAALCTSMPPQCWTLRDAMTCQKIQIGAVMDLRMVNWDFVHAIRRAG